MLVAGTYLGIKSPPAVIPGEYPVIGCAPGDVDKSLMEPGKTEDCYRLYLTHAGHRQDKYGTGQYSSSLELSEESRVKCLSQGHKIGGMSGLEPGAQGSESSALPLRHTTPPDSFPKEPTTATGNRQRNSNSSEGLLKSFQLPTPGE
ncbi:hypothetical protein Bbelb_300540 [Branchiostoma belcheri]|nr:hypothetical protein Bbelb_300540 [Branchiostoma belcheri]